jgi:translation initiation factor IF-3
MAKASKKIQLRVNIADRDLERKAKQAAAFREKGLGVNLSLRLARRESHRTSDAMAVINKFVAFAEVPERKVNALKWNDMTLETFIHP